MSEQSNDRELFERIREIMDFFGTPCRGMADQIVEVVRAPLLARIAELESQVATYKEVSVNRAWQVRELDILLNGSVAAKQASLCDIISQVRKEGIRSASYIAIDAAIRGNE